VAGFITEFLRRAISPKAIDRGPATIASIAFSQNRAFKPNVNGLRSWAKTNPWIRGAIDIRKNQIASADFEIGPFDVNRPYSKRMAQRITELFSHPNPRDRSFRAFITKVIDDLMTLDAGVSEGVEDLRGDLVQIWPVDAGRVRVSTTWDGSDPDEARYFWYPDGQYHGVNWKNNQMSYMMETPTTVSPIGISKLEILATVILSELGAADYNRRLVDFPIPDGLLHLGEGVPPEKKEEFRSEFYNDLAQSGALAITAGGKNPSYTPFRPSNKDMQFLEYQQWLVKQIALVFGESVQDLGLLFDINRSTSDTQAEQSEDRGLRPLSDLVQDEMTQQYVWHPSFGGPDNNLAFRFPHLTIRESTAKAGINKIALGGVPWLTINQALIDEGREPVGDINDLDNVFNQRIMSSPLGVVRLTEKLADIPTPAELAGLSSKAANGGAPLTPANAMNQPVAPVNAASKGPSNGKEPQ
jgi:hypothetical protein